jgi:hypothetical protein
MIDEELLKPSRELLANLDARIRAEEVKTREKINRQTDGSEGDQAVESALWHQFKMTVLPLRRERDSVIKTMAGYYAMQTSPIHTFAVGQTPGR